MSMIMVRRASVLVFAVVFPFLVGLVPAARAQEAAQPLQAQENVQPVEQAVGAPAAEINRLHFTLRLVEEYNDNIHEERHNPQADFITRVIPGIWWDYRAPRLDWYLNYHFEYVHYARNTQADELNHYLNTKATARLIDQFLFLEITDTFDRRYLDQSQGLSEPGNPDQPNAQAPTTSSSFQNLFTNATDENLFTVSPYFRWHLTPQLGLTTGYRYLNKYYSAPALIDWERHEVYATANYVLTQQSSLQAGATASRTFPVRGEYYDRLTVYVGFRYDFGDRSHILMRVGASEFQAHGETAYWSPYWYAELVHRFGRNTATITAGITYESDPTLGASEDRFVRGRLQRGYDRLTLGAYGGYSQTWNNYLNERTTSQADAGIEGTYQHTGRLSSHANVGATWYYDSTRERPCRLYANVGLRYAMNYGIWTTFDYKFISNRLELSGGDATTTNIFILTLNKGW